MERFKTAFQTLEKEVKELKEELHRVKGIPVSKGDVRYVSSTQEFGEIALDHVDTFRFYVSRCKNVDKYEYAYTLTNPTPELESYLKLQQVTQIGSPYMNVNPNQFESYCMENCGTNFVLTAEIKRCLNSKLWEFARNPYIASDWRGDTETPLVFSSEIAVPFEHIYKIFPHVSFYTTPNSLDSHTGLDAIQIKEITTKHVLFRITYGNSDKGNDPAKKRLVNPDLKLHYCIQGILEPSEGENLLG